MTGIRKLLVANRGEIAVRVMRTARDMGIATVAVYSDPDAAAPHVAAADEAVRLAGAAPGGTYLRGGAIIAAARLTGADAVHPGYGFLAENAGFARDCQQAGLTFVGPAPATIAAMGSKLGAKELMAKAGVPVLPSAVLPSDDLDPGWLAATADRIGYPVLVKADAGGGGRGMRLAHSYPELAGAVASAQREAASAFGDGTVFLEKYVTDPRHVEVQIFGDSHGTVVHLFERECSVQRRYQKIIEESPSPAVDEALRAELGAAAVAAGKAVSYTGAGTAEFVLDAGGTFYFLEMNTRLQVEHPVTELVTGLDLVRLQLLVAAGEPLPPEVMTASVRGHAIEARLYAEDPAAGFRPASGTLHHFSVPAGPGVRVDAGVADGSEISTYYDPMLAKVIGYGATRDQARQRLARALAGARLHGVTTNRELLTAILREPEFAAGRTDTGYLTRHEPAALTRPDAATALAARQLHALAAALAGQAARRAAAPVLGSVPSGWRNVPAGPQHAEFWDGEEEVVVSYRFRGSSLWAAVDGTELPGLVLWSQAADRIDLEAGGIRRVFEIGSAGPARYVDSPLGSSTLTEQPRFPEPGSTTAAGSLLAPMPGTVVSVAVSAGDQVSAGDPVMVLEAMKMEHTVAAPHAGTVTEVRATPGQAVGMGAVLAVVQEPS
jgi:acetyl/propionyl-CoA carboxylase alpha subunit